MTKEMAPHEQRVVSERYELNDKIAKLSAFLSRDMRDVAREDVELLNQQLHHMREYLGVLDARISRFVWNSGSLGDPINPRSARER